MSETKTLLLILRKLLLYPGELSKSPLKIYKAYTTSLL